MAEIDQIYNKMLSEGENDFQKVGWGSKDSQEKRFQVLTEIADIQFCSILDVGCGLGAFFDYLTRQDYQFRYTGVDINPNMVREAQQRFPEIRFVCADITAESNELDSQSFDYVFLSGALNLSADDHATTIQSVIKAMFGLANKGVAINFLSIFSDYFSAGEYYSNPEKMLQFGFDITPRVSLRHDYMPHDFTLYLYK